MRRWSPGDVVVVRETWQGRPWQARAEVVVDDGEEELRLFLPNGIRWATAVRAGEEIRLPEGDWDLDERRWLGGPILSFAWPDAAYAVLLFFAPDWSPLEWYVNLQDPLRRTSIGFDTTDHTLDVIVAPDRSSWRWKDEDELDAAIELGLYTHEQAAGFRAQGERAVERILRREPPFDRDWWDWRPDPAWPEPSLPDDWDRA